MRLLPRYVRSWPRSTAVRRSTRRLTRRSRLSDGPMLRVVFDTVVFVRALLNLRSVPGRVVFHYADRYQLILSTPLVVEILRVMARDEIVGKLQRRRGTYLE